MRKAQTSEHSKPPRVSVSISTKSEPHRRYPDGATFDKVFDDKTFIGTVVGFDAKEEFYSILYYDGDRKELDEKELNILIGANNTTNLKYQANVAKKRKTQQQTQCTANSALQLAPKRQRALGKDIANGKQSEMAFRPLPQTATIGTNTDSSTIHEPMVNVDNAAIDPETGATLSLKQLLHGNNKKTWKESHSDEWGRFTQGNGQVKGTGT